MGRRLALILALLACGALAVQAASAHRLPKAPKCPILPKRNHFNQRVDKLPAAASSATIVASIGRQDSAHADFGSGSYGGGPIGIPYTVVRRKQKKVPVSFDYAAESDRGRYPIPPRAPIEGGPNAGGDRHVLVVNRARCRLYELYDAHRSGRRHELARRLGRGLQGMRMRCEGCCPASALRSGDRDRGFLGTRDGQAVQRLMG